MLMVRPTSRTQLLTLPNVMTKITEFIERQSDVQAKLKQIE